MKHYLEQLRVLGASLLAEEFVEADCFSRQVMLYTTVAINSVTLGRNSLE